ncbi:hypothetical protein JTB14_029049 [Gonioctena quinquepunctata]|nr:hypothetical protein JTB14_029049 [Gonioctena quinquepunctata]
MRRKEPATPDIERKQRRSSRIIAVVKDRTAHSDTEIRNTPKRKRIDSPDIQKLKAPPVQSNKNPTKIKIPLIFTANPLEEDDVLCECGQSASRTHFLVDIDNPVNKTKYQGSIARTEKKYGHKLTTMAKIIKQQVQIEDKAGDTPQEYNSAYAMEQNVHKEPEKIYNKTSDIPVENNDEWTTVINETLKQKADREKRPTTMLEKSGRMASQRVRS